MPALVLPDRLYNASYEQTGLTRIHIRSYIVRDYEAILSVNGNAITDPFVMIRALAQAGMPQLYDPHPSLQNCWVAKHEVHPRTQTETQVLVYYVQPPFVGLFVCYHDSSSVQQTQTQLLPGTWQPIRPGYIGPPDPITGIVPDPTNKDATCSIFTNFRRLTLSGILYKPQPDTLDAARACVRTVNKNPWHGLPPGFWFCENLETTNRDNDNVLFDVSVSFISNQIEDWSTYGLTIQADGEPVKVDPNIARSTHDIPYGSQQCTNGRGIMSFQSRNIWGLVKVCPYTWSDFFSVFGVN